MQPEGAVHARMAASSRRQGLQRWYTVLPAAKLQHTTGTPAHALGRLDSVTLTVPVLGWARLGRVREVRDWSNSRAS